MKDRAHWNDLTEPEILREIEERKELIRQMVGGLYPSILGDEIADLRILNRGRKC